MCAHRFTDGPSLLDHPHRRRVVALVRDAPGLHVGAVARLLGISRAATLHHVRALRRARLLVLREGVRHAGLYPPARDAAALPPDVARCPARRALFEALAERPGGMTRAELHAAAAGEPHRTRNHAIRALVTVGLVEVRAGPGGEVYALASPSPVRRDGTCPTGPKNVP